MVEDIKLQISLFQHYIIPTLPLHSQQDSSDIFHANTCSNGMSDKLT